MIALSNFHSNEKFLYRRKDTVKSAYPKTSTWLRLLRKLWEIVMTKNNLPFFLLWDTRLIWAKRIGEANGQQKGEKSFERRHLSYNTNN